jgi:hypothetical protein
MQAAVDAAHAAQDLTHAADTEPVTEPLPRIQAAVAAQESQTSVSSIGAGDYAGAWSLRLGEPAAAPQSADIDAIDGQAATHFAADPDLTAAYDDVALNGAGKNGTRPADPPGGTESPAEAVASGWDAFRGDFEAGTAVKHKRAGNRGVRSLALAGVIAIAAVLIAGGVVALALTSRNSPGNAPSDGSDRAKNAAAAREAKDIASAATWVASQVNRTAVVACDPAMCQALGRHGFPESQLRWLGQNASYPVTSTLVVLTPVVQHQFGTSLAANWAPAVLAGFGSGAEQITVRVMAPHGTRAYESALGTDKTQRKAFGAGLITSRQISTSPAARSEMAAGDVDARLLIVITALASQHPIDILAFGKTWPGTSTGIPVRTAYLAENDPAAAMSEAAYVQAIIAELRGQPAAYRPVRIAPVRIADQKALEIEFPAPSPLGLISPGQ